MATFFDIARLIPTLGHQLADSAEAEQAQTVLLQMPAADLDAASHEWAGLSQLVTQVGLMLAGVTAIKSPRAAGHSGFAQSRGHRTPASFIQELTGSTKAEAARLVRVGEALIQGTALPGTPGLPSDGGDGGVGAGGAGAGGVDGLLDITGGNTPGSSTTLTAPTPAPAAPSTPWHAPLGRALHDRRLREAQFEAIRRGLGEPPSASTTTTLGTLGTFAGSSADAGAGEATGAGTGAGDASAAGTGAEPGVGAGAGAGDASGPGAGASPDGATGTDAISPGAAEEFDAAAREAWSLACDILIEEAAVRTPEELQQTARLIRDQLDPDGAEARFMARFENRSFRTYRDGDGHRRATWVFDDDGDIFVETLLAAGMRPRLGGPRFVDSADIANAHDLTTDPRTNDQLAYDLMMDVLRAGSLAEPEAVFGTRQAGVRLVHVIDTTAGIDADHSRSLVYSEDGLIALPSAVADRQVCESGAVRVTVDHDGNPLNMGRQHRLFTTAQRIALAIRDGGCRWNNCGRPASYCEAHHIDPYAEGGKTDIDRGILLCRFHHMNLHHKRWKITRDGTHDFVLHHPNSAPVVLKPRAALKYAWDAIVRPPKRFRPARV